jgi:hypothetical protein
MMLRYSKEIVVFTHLLVDRDTIEIIVSIKIYRKDMDDIINIFGFVFLKHTLRD